MDLSEIVRRSLATLGRRPGELLSWYVFGAAVPVVARAIVVIGVGVSYLFLALSGRLETLERAIAAGELGPPPTDESEEAIQAWFEATLPHLEGLFSPFVGAPIAASLFVAVSVFVPLYFATAAARIAACDARLDGDGGIAPGLDGARRYWTSFLALFVLEALVWIGFAFVALFGLLLAGFFGPIGAIFAFGTFAGLFVALAFVRLLFAFAPIAVVADDASAADGLRSAFGFLRTDPAVAFVYAALAALLLSGLGVFGVGLSLLGAGSVVALLGLFVVSPFLDLLKTGVYKNASDGLQPPVPASGGLGERFGSGLRRGLREMTGFVRETPGLHAVAAISLLAGFASGYTIVAPLDGTVTTSVAARTDELVFGVAAIDFFANNWSVALSLAFSGFAFGAPALVSLWFNGLVFGAVGRLEIAPLELVAFVVPHGLFEIPAILIAGAVGIRLGIVAWRAAGGRTDRSTVIEEIRRGFWVLVGVGVLLAIAGLIEGVFSPYYYDLLF